VTSFRVTDPTIGASGHDVPVHAVPSQRISKIEEEQHQLELRKMLRDDTPTD
jgi:hypothetical protein